MTPIQSPTNLNQVANSEVLAFMCELADRQKERLALNPRSRINPPKNEEEREKRRRQFTSLNAKIDEFGGRLMAFGLVERKVKTLKDDNTDVVEYPTKQFGVEVARSTLNFFSSKKSRFASLRLGQ